MGSARYALDIADSARRKNAPQHSYTLAFARQNNSGAFPEAALELIHCPGASITNRVDDPSKQSGYWKIGITVRDVDIARQLLLANGIEVSTAAQFLDIGYLCHLADPDGYSIELLQHDFEENHESQKRQSQFALGTPATLGQVTLRITDPEKSLAFYETALGLRLLSRQIIPQHGFTLYFLAEPSEDPPYADVDAVQNREWLWRRPYTVLQLQHRWAQGNERTSYVVGPEAGFERLSFRIDDLETCLGAIEWAIQKPAVRTEKSDLKGNHITSINIVDLEGYSIPFN